LFFGQLAVADRKPEQDLDVHLVVGRVDAGRVVDGIGVDSHAGKRRLDAAALCHPQVAALGEHLGAQIPAVDAQCVVRTIADVGMRFGACLDIGADAAVVEQIDLCLENGREQFGRRHAFGSRSQRSARLRRQRNRFLRTRPDATACRDQFGVVIRP
jgi:hypothetical protein